MTEREAGQGYGDARPHALDLGEQPPGWGSPSGSAHPQPAPDAQGAADPQADPDPVPDPDPPPAPGAWYEPVQPPATDTLGGAVRDPRRRKSQAALSLAVTLALLAGLGGGFAGSWLQDQWAPTTGAGRDPGAVLPPPAQGSVERAPDTVAGIAGAVLPSVVSIRTQAAQGEGTGSGFVLRDDGYILTNNHVVAGAADSGTIQVIFHDGSREDASVVGRTASYDLAVLKVDRAGLRALELGDSDATVVGDPVIAVGAPLGLQGTVTTGIISAKNRPVAAGSSPEVAAFINAIQTDAAINPGNSGGPLVNSAGQVVGVNSAIARAPGNFGATGGSIGLGFAIPSNEARRTADQLIQTGTATYPVIGVLLDRRYRGEGVRVSELPIEGMEPVTPGGPADQAGLEPGDVIVGFEGRPVTEPDELIVAIRAQSPGDTVTLTVRSGDEEREVQVVLDAASSD